MLNLFTEARHCDKIRNCKYLVVYSKHFTPFCVYNNVETNFLYSNFDAEVTSFGNINIKRKNSSPADTLCRIWFTSSWIVSHLSLSGAPSLAVLLPFLTSDLDLGAVGSPWSSPRPHLSEGICWGPSPRHNVKVAQLLA